MTKEEQRLWNIVYAAVGGRIVVADSGCWEWQGPKNNKGYGMISVNHYPHLVHRVAYTAAFGPPGQLCVLHRCDNRICAHPLHHFLGTKGDNNRDMWAKGRARPGHLFVCGGENPVRKLTPENVAKIKSLFGVQSLRSIARDFGVAFNTIHCIYRGATYREERVE